MPYAKAKPAVREEAYRNALMWAFDRLTIGYGGMNEREQQHTAKEIGNVLLGRDSPAERYSPNEWDDSAKLTEAGRSALQGGEK
jgi:hypothetical protein